jgi:hypothetical protein
MAESAIETSAVHSREKRRKTRWAGSAGSFVFRVKSIFVLPIAQCDSLL